MNTKLYVGNLPFDVTESQLKELFSTQGAVTEVNVIMDNYTGKSRGFAFVEMEDSAAMQSAIDEFDGKDFNGRSLKVNEAKPRENRPFRGDNHSGKNGNGGSRKDNRGRW